jgi:phosphohistidine phosphatase
MRLYIVRHAIAVPRGTPGVRDDDRALTEKGVRRMRQAAVGLRRLGYIPELLLSSSLTRAIQTAEILRAAFGKGLEMDIVSALSPSGDRRELYREIARHSRRLKGLMLVGHQPSLGEIAGEIAWGSAQQFIDFKKGGMCAIELESVKGIPKGRLVSLLTPSILRKIGS